MKLDKKIALITGGGRGIGKGCALELAASGADIVLDDRPGSPDLEATAAEIRALGRSCTPIEADVFTRVGCEALIEKALQETGRIDILISNPARSHGGKFLEFPAQEFDRAIASTLSSGFHVSQLVAQHMVKRGGGGKIIFISSIHGFMPYAGAVAYNAAKAGLNHMAGSIALELARHRINVNAILPGWIDTPGEHERFSQQQLDAEGTALPLGRLGLPSDIGKAAVFLASDDADYITGSLLTVDGGYWMKDCGWPANP